MLTAQIVNRDTPTAPILREIAPPYPSRCVWSKLPVFNALGARFYRKPFVLSSLEAKFLKRANLRGWLREMERTRCREFDKKQGLERVEGRAIAMTERLVFL